MKVVITRLRSERLRREWSLQHVGREIGVSNQLISMIENAQRLPSYSVVLRLESLFGLSHRELFSEIEDNDHNATSHTEPVAAHSNSTTSNKEEGK